MTHAVVRIEEIRPDPNQPRKYFKKPALDALARSIELVGQLTPIHVRKLPKSDDHRFEIIDGERRWRAHQIAGLKTIKVTIEEGEPDDRRRHLLSTISNFHREGHTHMEISDALQYQRSLGETVGALCENLAKSEGWVYQYLGLQRLAPELRDKLHPDAREDDLLRFSEAVVIASVPVEHQVDLYRDCGKQDRGGRLTFLRTRAAALQGKERIGRAPRLAEREAKLDNCVSALCRHMDFMLDLKERDFEVMLLAAEPDQLKRMLERLTKLRGDIGIMLVALERARKKAA